MPARQSTLGEHAANTDTWPPVGRDEWGPTARRPLPQPEAFWTVDELELRRRGFSPDTLAAERRRATAAGRHVDDAHREDHHPGPEDAAISADLAGVSEYDDPREWCDKTAPIHRETADPSEVRA